MTTIHVKMQTSTSSKKATTQILATMATCQAIGIMTTIASLTRMTSSQRRLNLVSTTVRITPFPIHCIWTLNSRLFLRNRVRTEPLNWHGIRLEACPCKFTSPGSKTGPRRLRRSTYCRMSMVRSVWDSSCSPRISMLVTIPPTKCGQKSLRCSSTMAQNQIGTPLLSMRICHLTTCHGHTSAAMNNRFGLTSRLTTLQTGSAGSSTSDWSMHR